MGQNRSDTGKPVTAIAFFFFSSLLFHKQQRKLAASQILIYRQHLFLGIYFCHWRTIAAKCTYYRLEIYFWIILFQFKCFGALYSCIYSSEQSLHLISINIFTALVLLCQGKWKSWGPCFMFRTKKPKLLCIAFFLSKWWSRKELQGCALLFEQTALC